MYEGTWDSVGTHVVPDWYDDAKLGVFVHWGLYSVPGWAPRVPDIQQLLTEHGPKRMLFENPYAEWYLNSMQLPGSPTAAAPPRGLRRATTPTRTSSTTFDDPAARPTSTQLADLCRTAGARYVVLTTKHHDGFALWPSQVAHPVKGAYHARRDLVGDLTAAVRARRMRMGLYYSGGYDWPYNNAVLARAGDAVLAAPQDDRYREYVTAHVRELIDALRAVGVVERHLVATRRQPARTLRLLLQPGGRRRGQRPLAGAPLAAHLAGATGWCWRRAISCSCSGRSSPPSASA